MGVYGALGHRPNPPHQPSENIRHDNSPGAFFPSNSPGRHSARMVHKLISALALLLVAAAPHAHADDRCPGQPQACFHSCWTGTTFYLFPQTWDCDVGMYLRITWDPAATAPLVLRDDALHAYQWDWDDVPRTIQPGESFDVKIKLNSKSGVYSEADQYFVADDDCADIYYTSGQSEYHIFAGVTTFEAGHTGPDCPGGAGACKVVQVSLNGQIKDLTTLIERYYNREGPESNLALTIPVAAGVPAAALFDQTSSWAKTRSGPPGGLGLTATAPPGLVQLRQTLFNRRFGSPNP